MTKLFYQKRYIKLCQTSYFIIIFYIFLNICLAQENLTNQQQKLIDSLVKIKVDSTLKAIQIKQNTRPKPTKFQYRLVGDGLSMQGNINRILFTTRAEIVYDLKKIHFESSPRFAYGEQNTNLAERDFFMDMNISMFHEQKIYGFGLGAYEFSNLRGILERYVAGIGIGWQIIRKENFIFSISNAVFYESTNFTRRTDFTTWRNSTRVKLKYNLFNNHLRFLHYIFYQPSLEDFSNVRWNINNVIEIPVYSNLNFRISLDNFYESLVVDNRKNNDLTFRIGLSWGNRR
jgi:hypothetical protein